VAVAGGIVVLVLAAQMVGVLVTNENFGWAVVANWLRADSIIRGLGMTLMLTVIAMTIGIVLGVLLAVARLSVNTSAARDSRSVRLVLPRNAYTRPTDLLL